ncbi:enoyl-CoA hydratase/carnithine racemase-like protein, partial [Pasteurella multocida P1933]
MRCKEIDVSDSLKWDLIELTDVTEAQVKHYFNCTKGPSLLKKQASI